MIHMHTYIHTYICHGHHLICIYIHIILIAVTNSLSNYQLIARHVVSISRFVMNKNNHRNTNDALSDEFENYLGSLYLYLYINSYTLYSMQFSSLINVVKSQAVAVFALSGK